jgi:hypothetical protein
VGAPSFEEKISEKVRARLAKADSCTLEEYVAAQKVLAECRRLLEVTFGDFDVLLVPSAPGEAPQGLATTGDAVFNQMWTALHTPAVTVPVFKGRRDCRWGRSSSDRLARLPDARLRGVAYRAGILGLAKAFRPSTERGEWLIRRTHCPDRRSGAGGFGAGRRLFAAGGAFRACSSSAATASSISPGWTWSVSARWNSAAVGHRAWVERAGYNRDYPQDCAWVTSLYGGYELGREPFPAPREEPFRRTARRNANAARSISSIRYLARFAAAVSARRQCATGRNSRASKNAPKA